MVVSLLQKAKHETTHRVNHKRCTVNATRMETMQQRKGEAFSGGIFGVSYRDSHDLPQ